MAGVQVVLTEAIAEAAVFEKRRNLKSFRRAAEQVGAVFKTDDIFTWGSAHIMVEPLYAEAFSLHQMFRPVTVSLNDLHDLQAKAGRCRLSWHLDDGDEPTIYSLTMTAVSTVNLEELFRLIAMGQYLISHKLVELGYIDDAHEIAVDDAANEGCKCCGHAV